MGPLNVLLSSGLGCSCLVLGCHVSTELWWGHLAILLLLCLIFSPLPGPTWLSSTALGFLAARLLFLVLVRSFLLWLQALRRDCANKAMRGKKLWLLSGEGVKRLQEYG